jgi:hypothetical protein
MDARKVNKGPPPPKKPRWEWPTSVDDRLKAPPASHLTAQDDIVVQMQVAVADLVDIDKMAYEMAVSRCPHLIERESAPIKFLLASDFRFDVAARRLVMYWSRRISLFGSTKGYEPLVCDGVCQSVHLSRSTDLRGRSVISVSDCEQVLMLDEKRYIFNLLNQITLSDSPIAQDEGIVIVVYPFSLTAQSALTPSVTVPNSGAFNYILDLVQNMIPVKVYRIHKLLAQTRLGMSLFGEQTNHPNEIFRIKTIVHPIDDRLWESHLHQLHGVPTDALPNEVHALFQLQRRAFAHSEKERTPVADSAVAKTEIEDDDEPAPSSSPVNLTDRAENRMRSRVSNPVNKNLIVELASVPPKKRTIAENSKLKRERQKVRCVDLLERKTALLAENGTLKREHERLSSMLKEARKKLGLPNGFEAVNSSQNDSVDETDQPEGSQDVASPSLGRQSSGSVGPMTAESFASRERRSGDGQAGVDFSTRLQDGAKLAEILQQQQRRAMELSALQQRFLVGMPPPPDQHSHFSQAIPVQNSANASRSHGPMLASMQRRSSNFAEGSEDAGENPPMVPAGLLVQLPTHQMGATHQQPSIVSFPNGPGFGHNLVHMKQMSQASLANLLGNPNGHLFPVNSDQVHQLMRQNQGRSFPPSSMRGRPLNGAAVSQRNQSQNAERQRNTSMW